MIFEALLLLVVSMSIEGANVSLSPDTWPAGEFERIEQMNLNAVLRPKPLAVSNGKGLVGGTTQPFAVHAGMDALRKGGNAMDACIATALAEVSLAMGSYVSYAGVAQILYYQKSTDKFYSINGGWNTALNESPSNIPAVHTSGDNGASVLVPGFIAGVVDGADKFAKFPLNTLFEPALYFAEKGFKMPLGLANLIKIYFNSITLKRTPEGERIFKNPNTGLPYGYKEQFQQPDMAQFIRNVSEHGKEYFYNGYFAEIMTSLVQEKKGFISLEDMHRYQAKWEEPVNTSYNGYDVFTTGNDWGGVELVEKLNLIELAGIGQSSDSYLTNETKFFWLASISRLSFFVSSFLHYRPNGLGILKKAFDLDFSNRQTKDSANAIWERIGTIENMKEVNAIIKNLIKGGEKTAIHGSDGVVAVDSDGNVCSMIHTINSLPWGTGLFVQGVALPHSGAIFKAYVKQTTRGGRLASGLQPTIALRPRQDDCDPDSRWPVMALAVVGSSYPVVVPQYITSLLDSNMDPKEAMESPTFLMPNFISFFQDVPIEKFSVSNSVLEGVRNMGQGVYEVDYHKAYAAVGLGVALTVDKDGVAYGCAHPLRAGFAEGV